MSIVSSGLVCDVWGKHVLPVAHERYEQFTTQGIDGMLHCHSQCRVQVELASKAHDWTILPEGPLRTVFEEDAKRKATEGTTKP